MNDFPALGTRAYCMWLYGAYDPTVRDPKKSRTQAVKNWLHRCRYRREMLAAMNRLPRLP